MYFGWRLFLLNNLLLKKKTNYGQAQSFVSLRLAHSALEDHIALPQCAVLRAVEMPSCGVCFEHAQNKRRRMAF